MLAVLLPFLKKFWPYIVTAGLCFSTGCYAGYRFEIGAAEIAKLALATQLRSDAAAVADANAIAASDLAQADAKAYAVESQLAIKNAQAETWEATLTNQIEAQASLPGDDATDSPVLAATLDALAKGNQ